ncbi:uncharacterized protein LOC103670268 isoform X2 [Ursus maritimus]|uniref:Uncharacterized protein LOC103670268 isoform X2 n=1 Tax=Ursus maritimus TaxID=29073 RepID=A0A8M1FX81_URSMA|nr:uncharacterized protein LOC103670268 isoform X2 [Ursus maritimus]
MEHIMVVLTRAVLKAELARPTPAAGRVYAGRDCRGRLTRAEGERQQKIKKEQMTSFSGRLRPTWTNFLGTVVEQLGCRWKHLKLNQIKTRKFSALPEPSKGRHPQGQTRQRLGNESQWLDWEPWNRVGKLRPREGRDLTQICHWLEAKPGPGPRCLAFQYCAHYPALILLWNYL